jgi:hypothetical protein
MSSVVAEGEDGHETPGKSPLFLSKTWPKETTDSYSSYSYIVIAHGQTQHQSQHSDIAKAVMNSCASSTMSSPPLSPAPNPSTTTTADHNLAIPKLHEPQQSHAAPPTTTSLGRALLGNTLHEGVGHPLSDTPMGSATPATAPGSPRM